jgi:membrane associated rhomboid family serine protease
MFANIPTATRALILINIGVFVLQQYMGDTLQNLFALWPHDSAAFRPWQLLSYAFLHGSIGHIFLNMFALFMFGRALEAYWGARRFVIFYLVCVLAAALTQLAVEGNGGPQLPVLGASGGVFGVLLAFAWYFPKQRLILIPIPIPLPAWLFVTLYALAELIFGITGTEQGVAHFAHLGGMLGGALCILYWRARRRFSL